MSGYHTCSYARAGRAKRRAGAMALRGKHHFALIFFGTFLDQAKKGYERITYNHLNLPVQVNKGASDYIVYPGSSFRIR